MNQKQIIQFFNKHYSFAIVFIKKLGWKNVREALQNIRNGEYAKRFILEGATNYPEMTAKRRLNAEHPIETTGAKLRAMMPWIKANQIVDQTKN